MWNVSQRTMSIEMTVHTKQSKTYSWKRNSEQNLKRSSQRKATVAKVIAGHIALTLVRVVSFDKNSNIGAPPRQHTWKDCTYETFDSGRM